MGFSLKNKGITITDEFQKITDECVCKRNKIQVDKGIEFYKRTMKSWLQDNLQKCIQHMMKENLLLLKDLLGHLRIKFTNLVAVLKNVYTDLLDDIVDKYNNKYHRTIKMKPIDVKKNTYTDFKVESNDKDPKFKVVDHKKYPNIKTYLPKSYTPNWLEKAPVIKKVKNIVPWAYVISDLMQSSPAGRWGDKFIWPCGTLNFYLPLGGLSHWGF